MSATSCADTGKEIIENYAINEIIRTDVNNKEPQNFLIADDDQNSFTEENTTFDISDIYGQWVVGDVVFRDITSVTKDGRGERPSWDEELVGTIVEYNADAVVLNNNPFKIKSYEKESNYFDLLIKGMSMVDNIHLDFMEKYNLDARFSKCYFVYFKIMSKSPTYPDIGTHFIVLNKNHILFLSSGGCFFDGFRVEINNLEQSELPTPPEPADPQYLYGKWQIQYSLREDEGNSNKFVGYILEYQKDFIVLGDEVYNNPRYAYDVPLPDKDFGKWFPYVDDVFLEGVGYFYSQYIFIDGSRINALGEHVYYVNEDNILIFHDNTLYRAKRIY